MSTYTQVELCGALGKPALVLRNIQKSLGLPVVKPGDKYSEGYKSILERIISLRVLGVSNEDIIGLLEIEKKILHLLHVDSLSDTTTWYLDHCGKRPGKHKGRSMVLLLTDYELEPSASAQSSQENLDFAGVARQKELFAGREIDEDIKKAVERYRKVETKILGILEREVPVVEKSSEWARAILRRKPGS